MSVGLESMRQVALENADDPATIRARHAEILTKLWHDMWGDTLDIPPQLMVPKRQDADQPQYVTLWWRRLDYGDLCDQELIKRAVRSVDEAPAERYNCVLAIIHNEHIRFGLGSTSLFKSYDPGV